MWIGWAEASTPPQKTVELLLDFPKGWAHFSAEKETKLEDVWKIDGKVLKCLGKPSGYLRTKSVYENFELELEWKYPSNENGNSGILIHTNGPDKIWPISIQVQLHLPKVGEILPQKGAKTANPAPQVKDLKLAVNKWHKCRIRSEKGKITVFINGIKVNEVGGCEPQKGCIALQSQGSEIHFRNIKVTKLLPDSNKGANNAKKEKKTGDR